MATLTIKNVPEEVIKNIWKSISYDELGKNALTRKRKRLKTEDFENRVLANEKDPTVRLQKMIDDPENTSYWPFTPEEFIAEMKKW